MNIFNILDLANWQWCSGSNSIQPTLHLIKQVLSIIRIIVPIILIVMTTIDITKKVINPDDKDGQKKIMIRLIASLIVFLTPTIISLSLRVIDWGSGNGSRVTEGDASLSACWDNA